MDRKEQGTAISENGKKPWFVYILRCGNGTFYTGVTTDVDRRVSEHQANGPQAARYTRAFGPVELAYSCALGSKQLAYRMEYRIKQLSHEKKREVVANNYSKADLLKYVGLEE